MLDLSRADIARFLNTLTDLPCTLPDGDSPIVRIVRAGAVLMRAGDASDGAFVVFAGLFEATAQAPRPRRVGWASRGAWIGELGVLSGAPRSATVTAWRDSVVLQFTARQTRALLTQDVARLPALTAHLLRSGAREMRPRLGAYVIALHLPAKMTAALQTAAARLDGARVIIAADVDQGAATLDLARACEAPGLVVLLADEREAAWRTVTQRNADRVAVVSRETAPAPATSPSRPTDHLLVHDDHAVLTNAVFTDSAPYLVRPDAPGDLIDYLQMIMDEHANPAGLRRFTLFSALDDAALAHIQGLIDWRFIKRGARIIEAGRTADCLYLVGLGRLQASLMQPDGARKILGDSTRGSVVGELSVLLDKPRSADVHALRDSRVGVIDAAAFEALRLGMPRVSEQLARTAAERAQHSQAPARHDPPNTMMIARLDAEDRTARFTATLADALRAQGREVTIVTQARVETHLGVGAAALRPGQPGYRRLLAWLNRVSADHDVLLFDCPAAQTAWTWCCLRQVDRIVLVGHPQGAANLTPLESRARARPMPPPTDLVLLQAQGIDQAAGTSSLLAERPKTSVHHVRAETPSDLAAAARRIMGCARGIAFAGSSSRAPGHAGMVTAFERLGMPVDIASGSSAGALAAAACSMGLGPDAMLKAIAETGAIGRARARDLQPPYTSLLSGHRLDAGAHAFCGDRDFEDQIVPCRVSAVDLASNTLIYVDRGPMWRGLRASCSIPILYPPVSVGDQLLVDGGVISYIPVHAILPWCADGLAAMSDISDPTLWDRLAAMEPYGTQVSGWRQLFDRLLPWRRPAPRPALADVMFLSMIISNSLGKDRIENAKRHPAVCHVYRAFATSGLFTVSEAACQAFAAGFADQAVEQLTAWSDARAQAPTARG